VACDTALTACGIALSDDQRGTVRGASKREASAALVARPGAPVPRLAAAVSQRPHGREHGWEWASEGAGAEQDGHGRWWHSRVICFSSWGASPPSMCLERPWRRLAVRIGHRVD
jgi:hypothetical protein